MRIRRDRETAAASVELEQKLEQLSAKKNEAEQLKHVLTENERIQEELDALDLAQETMTHLSTSIRDSFGLYLNKTASELIEGITGGIYRSMSIDQDLNIFTNTPTRLVPIEQVSSGTADQIYLALRPRPPPTLSRAMQTGCRSSLTTASSSTTTSA